ncbi:hypothetical protein ACJIZ3_016676 [Penstemon smallii]|uniref:BRCT domain-containing protein n=1 Tax=Penstemon smallii TaxID=265156 RepID=A0ABD3STE8_9LAMI
MEYGYTDTLDLEAPIQESSLLNLDTNTEVVDTCELALSSGDHQMKDFCGKEVVLDSDDEGEQNEDVDVVNGQRLQVKRQRIRTGYFRRLGTQFSAHMSLPIDSASRGDKERNAGRKCRDNDSRYQDHRVAINCVLSRSPDQNPFLTDEEELHADQEYLNMVKDSLTEDSLDEIKLSPPHSKAMDMEMDANDDCEHVTFNYVEPSEPAESQGKALEFVEHYLLNSDLGSFKDDGNKKANRLKSPPSLRSRGAQNLAKRVNLARIASKSMTFDWAEKQIKNVENKTKDSICGSKGDVSGYLSVYKDSNYANVQKEMVRSNSGIGIPYDWIKELDDQFEKGSTSQNMEKGEESRVTPDVFDVGQDTQMAAEAIESLIFAAPPIFDACFTHEVAGNTFVEGTSYNVNSKSKSKHFANPQEAFVGWRNKEKRSKCVKVSTVELNTDPFCSAAEHCKSQMGTDAQFQVKSKTLRTKKLSRRKDLNGRKPGITKKNKHGRPPRSTVQHAEDGFTEKESCKEAQKDRCLSESIGCKHDGRWSKETNKTIKSNTPLKRRMWMDFNDDTRKIGVSAKCLKLNSDSSFQVKNDKAKREEYYNVDMADSGLSRLNPWIHPKGKRTHQGVPRHSKRQSYNCSPCLRVYENNVEKCTSVNEEAHKRVPKLLVYTRRRLKHPVNSVTENESSDRQVPTLIEIDTAKPPKRFCELDNGYFPSSAGTSGNIKLDELSNGNSKTLQICEGSDKNKQPSNRLSISPLTKELTRLGYTESLPDFLQKDSRSRRAMKKVCVLFSQNLETRTLKKQRKIVARLGFSTASCCSDATHFVTDRFVRTRNLLEAIALSKPVVTHLWLESCDQSGYLIDETSYILRDEKKEKEIGFSLPLSLTRARQHPLLKGHRIFITPNVKPGADVIHSLVKAVHGKAIQNIQNAKTKDKVIIGDLLILSCEEDYKICLPFLEKGASVYSSELLLNGIVIQKLEYERHQLFKDYAKK